MDLATIIGLVLGFGAVFGGAILEGLHLTALIQPTAALIVLGGSMSANDDLRHPFLTPLKPLSVIPYWQKPPISASAWGATAGRSPGATVVQQRWEELGMHEVTMTQEGGTDPLFADAGSSFITFQWHHDSFDLPDGTRLLATSAACPNQAFRVGNAGWGLQFHPEVNEKIIRETLGPGPGGKGDLL